MACSLWQLLARIVQANVGLAGQCELLLDAWALQDWELKHDGAIIAFGSSSAARHL